jgi:hypothetical protein
MEHVTFSGVTQLPPKYLIGALGDTFEYDYTFSICATLLVNINQTRTQEKSDLTPNCGGSL